MEANKTSIELDLHVRMFIQDKSNNNYKIYIKLSVIKYKWIKCALFYNLPTLNLSITFSYTWP